jgi:uncharacterized protein with PIN domain/endonuclease/exonuclease/phosphatase family metal-dependent hydrolase
VDHDEEFEELLRALGYAIAYQKRPGGKVDGCLTAWLSSSFSLIEQKSISYDDLAAMASSELLIPHAKVCKHNVGLLVKLKQASDGVEFAVGNTHLHFDPRAEDVKMLQMRNFFEVLERFISAPQSSIGRLPAIACGDFNSMPSSDIYKLLAEGTTPPRNRVEPFRRFMFDDSLVRVARWLRLLGFDAEIFSISKVGGEEDALFQACETQHRLLVTASRFLAARRNCPTCLLSVTQGPKGAAQARAVGAKNAMERVFQELVCTTALQLDRKKFYTVCVLCNTPILPISREQIQCELGKTQNQDRGEEGGGVEKEKEERQEEQQEERQEEQSAGPVHRMVKSGPRGGGKNKAAQQQDKMCSLSDIPPRVWADDDLALFRCGGLHPRDLAVRLGSEEEEAAEEEEETSPRVPSVSTFASTSSTATLTLPLAPPASTSTSTMPPPSPPPCSFASAPPCGKLYWWNESVNSSAARAEERLERLLELARLAHEVIPSALKQQQQTRENCGGEGGRGGGEGGAGAGSGESSGSNTPGETPSAIAGGREAGMERMWCSTYASGCQARAEPMPTASGAECDVSTAAGAAAATSSTMLAAAMAQLNVAEESGAGQEVYHAGLGGTSLPALQVTTAATTTTTTVAAAAASDKEPLYTNRTTSFSGCLDYIFHDGQWRVNKLLPLPQAVHLVFPNKLWPSDHLAIMAELEP